MRLIDLWSPAGQLFGVRKVTCDAQGSTFIQDQVPAVAWSIGWLGVLADEAAGRPLTLNVPEGTHCPSQSLHFDLVRPPGEQDCRLFNASGSIVRVGDHVALTHFVITGADETPLVVGSMRSALLPNGFGPATVLTPQVAPDQVPTGAPDLPTLLGTALQEQGDGRARLEWCPATVHGNPVGSVHGGVHVALVDVALTAAVCTERPDWVLLGLDVSYHRPILLDGGPVTAEATVVHAGRTSVVAEAVVRTANGRTSTSARATFVPAA